MIKLVDRIKRGFKTSNHYKHFIACFLGTLIFGFGFAVGAGVSLEYKDYKYRNRFDVVDLLYSLFGGGCAVLFKYLISLFL